MAHLEQNEKGVYFISDNWYIEDVQSVRSDLTDDQAADVLEAVANNHDANIGINWDNLTYWADWLFPLESD